MMRIEDVKEIIKVNGVSIKGELQYDSEYGWVDKTMSGVTAICRLNKYDDDCKSCPGRNICPTRKEGITPKERKAILEVFKNLHGVAFDVEKIIYKIEKGIWI